MSHAAPAFDVTPESGPVGATSGDATAAGIDARAAAARAGVSILRPDDERAAWLIAEAGDRVWGPRGTFARNELRALMHAGDPVHLALDLREPDRPVVGFAVGFLGWSPILHVHSHQVGVLDGQRRRGIGYALKLAQRHTCLSNGITDMRWTFDPLIRRNTAFNLGALGARADSFHVNFYGDMDDAINGGDASDRLEAVWLLDRPLPSRAAALSTPLAADESGSHSQLIVDNNGWPELTDADVSPGALMAVPTDYETMRREDRSRSRAWRAASREVLMAAYSSGLRVGQVTTAGYQLVVQDGV